MVKDGQTVRQSPPRQRFVVAKLVVVAFVVVEFVAVKFCRVVEPVTKRSPTPLKEEVAVVPKKALPAERTVLEELAIFSKDGSERVQVRLVERS